MNCSSSRRKSSFVRGRFFVAEASGRCHSCSHEFKLTFDMSDEIGHHCGIARSAQEALSSLFRKIRDRLLGFQSAFSADGKAAQSWTGWSRYRIDEAQYASGEAFMFRERSTSTKALTKIFEDKAVWTTSMREGAFPEFPETIKEHFDYGGEFFLGI